VEACEKSRAEADPGGLVQPLDPRDKGAGVLALPAEGWVHDNHLGAQPDRGLGGALQLLPRVGTPDPLGDQQAGRVDRHHRHAVVVAQLLHRVDVGGDRVDADHHLDTVVAEPAGELEAAGGGLGVDRGGGEPDLEVGRLRWHPASVAGRL
jgi:hypothetical protein